MWLLSRFIPSAHSQYSSRLLLVDCKVSRKIRARSLFSNSQTYEVRGRGEWRKRLDDVEKLLCRPWLMPEPSTRISRIATPNLKAKEASYTGVGPQRTSREFSEHMQFANAGYFEATQQDEEDDLAFYVIRDDLLHPLLGGNKLRKLDALIPELERMGATDVVTCGGCQSAHTAALAFACAERGMSCHLLLRGEKPGIPTGYNLLCGMYGHVTYISRSNYADRAGMLSKHAAKLAENSGSVSWLDGLHANPQSSPSTDIKQRTKSEAVGKNVVVVNEGAGDAIALLGLIRLVHYLSQPTVFGAVDPLHIVVDTGTGTTAIGLAIGITLLGLPWKVTGVILADSVAEYERYQTKLMSDFTTHLLLSSDRDLHLPLVWEQRSSPRKFGRVFRGEIETCQFIARRTGILLDPIYSLAGWETALKYSQEGKGSEKMVMLHTGGTLGLFGLAQRFPEQFSQS